MIYVSLSCHKRMSTFLSTTYWQNVTFTLELRVDLTWIHVTLFCWLWLWKCHRWFWEDQLRWIETIAVVCAADFLACVNLIKKKLKQRVFHGGFVDPGKAWRGVALPHLRSLDCSSRDLLNWFKSTKFRETGSVLWQIPGLSTEQDSNIIW